MVEILLIVLIVLAVACFALLIALWRRQASDGAPVVSRLEALAQGQRSAEQVVRDELSRGRAEAGENARLLREEVTGSQRSTMESIARGLGEGTQQQAARFDALARATEERLDSLRDSMAKRLADIREEGRQGAETARSETTRALKEYQEAVQRQLTESAGSQRTQMAQFLERLNAISEGIDKRMENLRGVVDQRLKDIQEDNTRKLEEMRRTVDEKLEGTLERRLGESFKLVSERLETVHKGLGEMQTLASGVGDLKKVLTNVKTRGTWGEVQLGNLLEQVLTREQYDQNVQTKPGSSERVEFAIRLPGRSGEGDRPVWLPIDSKCPQEDYQRLVEAAEAADADGVAESASRLEARIKSCGREISEKYISPPDTTDFAILFVPTEGLFAEVLRRPGLTESLQRDFRVMVAGPTTLAALLNSLQMGFRTLAIEKRSSEVWNVLSSIKSEFGKFGAVLEKVKKKLGEATATMDDVAVRSRAVERKLRKVEELPAPDAADLLGLVAAQPDAPPDRDDDD